MFKLQSEMSWVWPVTVAVPDGGAVVTQHFRAKFRLAPDHLRHEIAFARSDAELQERTAVLMRAALVEIYDVVDERDAPLALTDALREAMLANPLILRGLTQAYGEALSGQPAAAEAKN